MQRLKALTCTPEPNMSIVFMSRAAAARGGPGPRALEPATAMYSHTVLGH